MTKHEYIKTTDCAKLIREDIKRHFPGVKFSVRSSRYSGGSSIRVSWREGPTDTQVKAVAQRREGATFDAMQDLKECHDDFVLKTDGTMQSVHYGADFVFCNRNYADYEGYLETIGQRLCQRLADCHYGPGWKQQRVGTMWLDQVAGIILQRCDFRTQTPVTCPLDWAART